MRPPRQGCPLGADAGFALLLVLWALVPVSLLFLMLSGASRSDARLAANLRGAAELEAVADGAIHTAIFELLQPGGAAPDAPTAPGVVVEVASLSGLVNPNVVSPELLRALMVRLGADPGRAGRVASAVADWRTPGRLPRPDGAKAPQYRAAGLGYGPPGASFETLSELRDVLGMTDDLLAALMPHLTLHWDGEPDPGLAGPVVAAALRDLGIAGGVGHPNARAVRITATAQRPNGARAIRRAVVRLGPTGRRGWRVLAWDAGQGP